MSLQDSDLHRRESAPQREIFLLRLSSLPFLSRGFLRSSSSRVNDGKRARAGGSRAMGRRKHRPGARPTNDADFRDAAGKSALARFELQDHSARNLVPANQIFNFFA